MLPSTNYRHSVAQPTPGHAGGLHDPAELVRLFRVRLSSKRRAVEAVLDRKIQRLLRLRMSLERTDAEVVLAAIDHLGSPAKAAQWLSSPQKALENAIPLYKAASDEGNAEVINLLMSLDS